MALLVKSGQFTGNGLTGNQAVTDVGFQPKAIVFYCTELEVVESNGNSHRCVGFATSSSERGTMSMSADDGSATSDVDNDIWATRCILIRDHSAGSPRFEADFVSFDTLGFTVNWIDSSDSIIFYVAIGGDDLTNAKVGHFTKKISTGTDPITGVGFEPDLILVMGELNTTQNSDAIDSSFFFGAATSSSSRWCTHGSSEDGRPSSDCGRNQRTNRVIYQTDENGTVIADVDLLAMTSDGFNLSYLTANGDANRYTYLALKGGSYKLASFNGATSTGNQSVSAVGFTPKLELFTGFSAAASGSEVASNHFQIGSASSSTERSSLFVGDEDAVGTTVCDQDINDTECLRFLDESETLLAEADFVSHGSGLFTVNWSTVDAISREILYLAMGDTPAPAPSPSGVGEEQARRYYYERKARRLVTAP